MHRLHFFCFNLFLILSSAYVFLFVLLKSVQVKKLAHFSVLSLQHHQEHIHGHRSHHHFSWHSRDESKFSPTYEVSDIMFDMTKVLYLFCEPCTCVVNWQCITPFFSTQLHYHWLYLGMHTSFFFLKSRTGFLKKWLYFLLILPLRRFILYFLFGPTFIIHMWALIHPVYNSDQPSIHDSVT